tara:strand:- start:981 stop:1241 length:261 start_codon:yes stop_codon:yes gene_type:complete
MASSRNNALEFSSAGSKILRGAASASGKFGAIQFLKDSTLSGTLTATNIDGSADLLTEGSFGAGTIIYGNFTTVQISSGVVALHKV